MSQMQELEIDVNSEADSTNQSLASAGSQADNAAGTPHVTRTRSLRKSRHSLESRPEALADVTTARDAKAIDESADEKDQATNVTASHYLEHRGHGAKKDATITVHNTPKKRRKDTQLQECYCWECHRECVDQSALDCHSCTRTFHNACLPAGAERPAVNGGNWSCPVCMVVSGGQGAQVTSMQNVGRPTLNRLLGYALSRMKHKDSGPFQAAVPATLVPDYLDYVFHPFDLSILEKNCKQQHYRCIDEFMEDAKWIVHNSHIFNGAKSKYTQDAKLIMRICKHEISELRLCPDCYRLSTERPDGWFTRPCHSPSPHCLVWAKLKGYPWWPAKVLQIANASSVDVRFFGEYDRGRVALKDCMLLSKEPPMQTRVGKKQGLDKAIEEVSDHIKQLTVELGYFSYAPQDVQFKAEYLDNCPLFDKDSGFEPATGKATFSPRRESSVNEDSLDGSSNSGTTPAAAAVAAGKSGKPDSAKKTRSVDKDVFTMDSDVLNAFSADKRREIGREASVDSSADHESVKSENILERLEQTLQPEQQPPPPAPKPKQIIVTRIAAGSSSTPVVQQPAKRPRESDDTAATTATAKTNSSQPPKRSKPDVSLSETLQSHKQQLLSNLQSAVSSLFADLSDCDLTVTAGKSTRDNSQPSTSSVSSAELAECQAHSRSLAGQLTAMRYSNEAFVTELKRSTMSITNDIKRLAEQESVAQMRKQRQKFDAQLQETVQQIKSKQWCAACGKEAVFYCCWNTSYCDYPCQQAHWPKHQATCAQVNNPAGASKPSSSAVSSSQSAASLPLSAAAAAFAQAQHHREMPRGLSPNHPGYRNPTAAAAYGARFPGPTDQFAMMRGVRPYLNGGMPGPAQPRRHM